MPATVSDVTRCLEAGADPNARDEWGATPLHYMAQLDGFAEAIEALASAGRIWKREMNGARPRCILHGLAKA